MARTAVTITTLSSYQSGVNLTATTGDAANDHSVDATKAPNLILFAHNYNAATVDFTVELAAGASSYNQAVSVSQTVPAAVGGIAGVRAVRLNVPADLFQSGNVIHVSSADANFGDIRFYAVTWA